MAGPYGKLKADKLVWWDTSLNGGSGGDNEDTLEDIANKAALTGATFTGTVTGPTINASTTLQIDGVAITSTAAELNILDGVTSTAAELNILDGVTSTAAELNYSDGVTSNIQTQLDAKQALEADLTALSSCQTGAATALALLTATEVGVLDGVTSTTAELNTLDGFTGDKDDLIYAKDLKATGVTSTEFDYLDGVTSAIQTQIDTKAPLASPALTGTATAVNLTLSGDLTVNGTTSTINSTTLQVDDKNIELGTVDTPSDSTADGGGITLKGATDKTIVWTNSTDTWDFNQGVKVTGTGTFTDDVSINADSKKLKLGASDDLEIYHDGSHSRIKNNTGALSILADDLNISNNANNEALAAFTADGSCELYYDNSKKIETTSAGVTVTGTVSDSIGDLRSIIQNTQGSTYTLVAADAGKHILASGTVTVPQSVFSAGDAVTIVNNTGSDLTITKSISTMYNTADDGDSANRTLAARGMATILFTSGTVSYISGAGLS